MTVAELIAKLKELPPDMQVFTHGYEGGLVQMNNIRVAPVSDAPPRWNRGEAIPEPYYGSHWDHDGIGDDAAILEHDGRRSNSGGA